MGTKGRMVVVGGGGHASDVLGVLEDLAAQGSGSDWDVAGLVHDGEIDGRRFEGRGVRQIGQLDDLASIDASHYVIALEYPTDRKAVHDRIAGCGLESATLIHPAASVGAGVTFGEGSVVFAGARVSPMVRAGAHVVLSNLSVVGYSAVLGDFVSVMPAGVVSGDVTLGDGATIGTTASVIEGVKVGEWAILGAGAVAVAYVPPRVTAIGVPATWKL
jgi:sugar O-acyltransferase (sialic acid O-acetyltransferase NeuD family)